jgi:dephospho-CoA kinase
MIIGIVGKKQSGKSTMGKYLINQFGFKEFAFATALKEMLIEAQLCNREELYGEKTQRSREFLQKIGTNIFRNQVDTLYWINQLGVRIKRTCGFNSNIVISDVRFENEGKWVIEIGGTLVRIVRDLPDVDYHASETEQDNMITDYVVDNNGSLMNLYDGVENLMLEVKNE